MNATLADKRTYNKAKRILWWTWYFPQHARHDSQVTKVVVISHWKHPRLMSENETMNCVPVHNMMMEIYRLPVTEWSARCAPRIGCMQWGGQIKLWQVHRQLDPTGWIYSIQQHTHQSTWIGWIIKFQYPATQVSWVMQVQRSCSQFRMTSANESLRGRRAMRENEIVSLPPFSFSTYP